MTDEKYEGKEVNINLDEVMEVYFIKYPLHRCDAKQFSNKPLLKNRKNVLKTDFYRYSAPFSKNMSKKRTS